MKSSKLYMSHWLKANGRERTQPTDNWYLDFAKEMFRIVEQSPLFAHTSVGTPAEAALKRASIFRTPLHRRAVGKLLPENATPFMASLYLFMIVPIT